jgi:hypothetical protein
MRITSAGDVGIGTTSPTSATRLDVVSPENATQYINVLRLKTTTTGDNHPFVLFESNRNSVPNSGRIGVDAGSSAGEADLVFQLKDVGGTFNTRATISNTGLFRFNSGYGSAATAYGCRAWVNFNGTGTVAIRASGNVSSITDEGTSNYTVNFSTAMPDANYAVCGIGYHLENATEGPTVVFQGFQTSGSVRVQYRGNAGSPDPQTMQVAIFR